VTIEVVLFDMGGVLVEIDWHNQVGKMLGEQIADHQIHDRWVALEAIHAFECGELDFDEFAQALKHEAKLTQGVEEIKSIFQALVVDEFAESVELIEGLKERYRIAVLSNTNSAHMPRVENFKFYDLIDDWFLSFEMGVMKPDAEIYQRVVEDLKVPAESILFFDDGLKNISQAKQLGLKAFQVQGVAEVKAILEQENLV
jgi:putative hydrolase of the HAD superfamily